MTYAEYRGLKYFPFLDGIRAASVLLVVSVHVQGNAFGRLAGYLGVTLFFIISGFLITTLALREEEQRGSLAMKPFYIRRSFRIFPLYFLALGVYVLLYSVLNMGGPDKKSLCLEALPAYLLYYQEVPHFTHGEPSAPFHHSWSLGIEEKFYLVWPLLAFVVLRHARDLRLTVALLLAFSFGLMPILSLYGLPGLAGCLTPYHFILMGCALALMMHDPAMFEQLKFLGKFHFLYAVVAVLAIAHYTMHFSVKDGFGAGWQSIYGILGTMCIAGLFMRKAGPIHWLLCRPSLVWIGGLSYGIYLFHLIPLGVIQKAVIGKVPETLFPYAVFFLASAVSIAIAWVLNKTFEKPMIRFGRAWAERTRKNDVQAPPAPFPTRFPA